MASQHLSSGWDAMTKEAFLPVVRDKLSHLTHTCGRPYDIRFLDRDGQVWRKDPTLDAWELILAAYCSEHHVCSDHNTSYQFVRISISGVAAAQHYRGMVELMKHEIMQATEALRRQMETLLGGEWKEWGGVLYGPGDLDPGTYAEIAEMLTLSLSQGWEHDPWTVRMDGKMEIGDKTYLRSHVEQVAAKLGFVTEDGQLALPAEHPLAA